MTRLGAVVVGSGVAGLFFALKAAERGRVAILTKKELMESNTNYAQGGIAASVGEGDSAELHVADTLAAGDGLCDEANVRLLAREGPRYVEELVGLGVGFNREHGRLAMGQEGGHSARRIVFAGDATGREVERALVFNVRATEAIETHESMVALDLIVRRGRCVGVRCLDAEAGSVRTFLAPAVVLATGGCGQVFAVTSNPPIATGDGVAMAFRAGAEVQDMEFVQFHPTTLDRRGRPHFLVSEALRGEGAVLLNARGERFMSRYHPAGELAPRDVVARAILAERRGGPVLLDISNRPARFVRDRFATIHDQLLRYGVNMAAEPIPVSPAAHYCCGGVRTDRDGRTSVPGLYALGECACTGVHGANRLASNSLLECLVFSARASEAVRREPRAAGPGAGEPAGGAEPLALAPPPPEARDLRRRLRLLMWRLAGIVRTGAGLHRASKGLASIEERTRAIAARGASVEVLELWNLVACSRLIVSAASLRRESRGAHYLLDAPERDDERWRCHVVQRLGAEPRLVPVG